MIIKCPFCGSVYYQQIVTVLDYHADGTENTRLEWEYQEGSECEHLLLWEQNGTDVDFGYDSNFEIYCAIIREYANMIEKYNLKGLNDEQIVQALAETELVGEDRILITFIEDYELLENEFKKLIIQLNNNPFFTVNGYNSFLETVEDELGDYYSDKIEYLL